MRVKIHRISSEEEEVAELYTSRSGASLERLRDYIEQEKFQVVSITASRDGASVKICSDRICYIESIREIQYVHTINGVYESRKRLYSFLEVLPSWFVRASKSVIVNLKQVKRFTPLTGGLMLAEFGNKKSAYISRKYVREIRVLLKEGLE